MAIKHLILDSEDESNQVYGNILLENSPTNGVPATFEIVFDLKTFKEKINSQTLWFSVTINFGGFQFATWKGTSVANLIYVVKNSQNEKCIIVGITAYSGQKSTLDKLGIPVVVNKFSRGEIKSKVFNSQNFVPQETVTIESIRMAVSEYFEIPYEKISQKTRKREIVQARQITMYLAKKFTKNSLKVIGEHFDGQDHTTVIHSVQVVKDLMDSDPVFKGHVLSLEEKIDEY